MKIRSTLSITPFYTTWYLCKKELHSGTVEGRILGDDMFIETVLSQPEGGKQRRVSLKKIMEVICKKYNVRGSDLVSGERRRKLSAVRTVIGYFLVEYGEGTLSDYGRYVNRDMSTLSNAIREFRERLKGDWEKRRIIEELKRELGVKNKKTKPDPDPMGRRAL